MNIELLTRVKEKILAQPLTFDIRKWGRMVEVTKDRPCGTVACIAGWACLLSEPASHLTWVGGYLDLRAGYPAELLDLTMDKAAGLFHLKSWPEPYREEYTNLLYGTVICCAKHQDLGYDDGGFCFGKPCNQRFFPLQESDMDVAIKLAEVTARRIDHFIATEGKE